MLNCKESHGYLNAKKGRPFGTHKWKLMSSKRAAFYFEHFISWQLAIFWVWIETFFKISKIKRIAIWDHCLITQYFEFERKHFWKYAKLKELWYGIIAWSQRISGVSKRKKGRPFGTHKWKLMSSKRAAFHFEIFLGWELCFTFYFDNFFPITLRTIK